MTWVSGRRAPERIMLYGPAGAGKSEAILAIAAKVAPRAVRVVDTDYAWNVLLDEYEGDNIEVFEVDAEDWDGLRGTVARLVDLTEPDDWMCVDSSSPTWDAVQAWHTEKVYGLDIADYYTKLLTENTDAKNIAAFGQITDWNVINRQYAKLMRDFLKCRGHLLLTAEQTPTGDNEVNQSVFGKYGMRPKGNKRLIHMPHTVIQMRKDAPGEWTMTTRKDRKRDEMDNQVVTNFARDYLMRKGGWHVEGVE